MVAAQRKTPTVANGGSQDGSVFETLLETEVIALWKCVPTWLPTVGGSANAITAASDTALVVAITAYARPMAFWFTAAATNTGATTIAVDGLASPKSIRLNTGATLPAGAIVLGSDYLIVYDGTNMILINPTTTQPTPIPTMILRDQRTSGTSGDASTSGSYQTAALQTTVRNAIAGATLNAGNTFTLPAGTYCVEWWTTFFRGDQAQSRLFNVTSGLVVNDGAQQDGYGTTAYCNSTAAYAFAHSRGKCVFTLAAPATFRLERRVATSFAQGYGSPSTFGNVEIYTQIDIYKQ